MTTVFKIEHTQTLAVNDQQVTEGLEVSVKIYYEILSSGWLSGTLSNPRSRGTEFLVLIALALHARPLQGEDLDLLVSLGAATPQDEGRLYARVTDLALAAELGIHRKTVAESTERLAEAGLVDIYDLPPDYRDSHGQFAGTKAYVLAGDLMLAKEVVNHRATLSDTVEAHRATLSDTVEAQKDPTVALKVAHRATLSATNIYNNTTTNTPPYPPQHIESPFDAAVAAAWRAATGREPSEKDLETLLGLLGPGPEQTDLASLLTTIIELGRRKEQISTDDVAAIISGRLAMPPLLDQRTPPQQPAFAPVVTTPRSDSDPVLAQVTRWYEQEIGTRITQLVADDLRDLTATQRNLDVWEYAFQTSAHIHSTKARWNYITAVVQSPDQDAIRAWLAAGRRRPQPERKSRIQRAAGGENGRRASVGRAPVVTYEEMPDETDLPAELLGEPLPPPN